MQHHCTVITAKGLPGKAKDPPTEPNKYDKAPTRDKAPMRDKLQKDKENDTPPP